MGFLARVGADLPRRLAPWPSLSPCAVSQLPGWGTQSRAGVPAPLSQGQPALAPMSRSEPQEVLQREWEIQDS